MLRTDRAVVRATSPSTFLEKNMGMLGPEPSAQHGIAHGESEGDMIGSMRLGQTVLALLVGGLLLGSVEAASALNIERCVSQDNHLYVILTTSSPRMQVTSVAMTNMNANACCELPSPGDVLTAVAAGAGILLPNRARTTVISGLPSNFITCGANFVASAAGGQGQLTLPGGSTVSSNAGFSSNTVVPVTSSDVLVPAAFDTSGVSRAIPGCTVSGQTMTFPSTAGVYTPSDVTAGEQSSQTVTHDDTEGTTVGNRAPGNNVPPTQATADGFTLEGDCTNPATCETIVFIATQDGNIGSGVAASAFSIDSSDITYNTECNAQPILFNTPTRTATFTQTATATHTATSTNTATATATDTGTATVTATATGTVTSTPTTSSTPTASTTGTGTATQTQVATPTATKTGVCATTPQAGCATPVGFKRRLRISAKREIASWRWRSNATIPLADFGNPSTTSSYSLCIYAGASPTLVMELRAPAGGVCNGGKPCWKSRGVKGWRYRDLDKTPDGVTRLVLRTKPQHLADLVLRARGPNIPFPALPLAQPVLAQLVKSDGPECWQASYSPPPLKNDAQAYKDKND